MSLIYITGLSGSGKSSVCEELSKKGYEAHDADGEGINQWCNKSTGKIWKNVPRKEVEAKDWSERYSWDTSRKQVENLRKKAKDKHVFLCGVSANEEKLWELFDKVICLTIDENTLKERLATRTTNDFGKAPHELLEILNWHKTYPPADYLRKGAITIDASQTIENVVKDILRISSET